MELQQLKYFIAVAEHGSFSNAAVNLNVQQPKLSRCIRALEDELGTSLFFRTGRGVVVSEAGKFLMEQGTYILRTTQTIRSGIQSIVGNPGGLVRIGLTPSVGSIVALNILDEVAETFPCVQVEIEEAGGAHVLEWLCSGRVDLAVLSDAPKASTLLCQPLADEDLYLVCPATAKWLATSVATPQALHGRTILLIEGSPKSLTECGYFDGCDLRRLDNVAASLDFVRQGRGLALLPASTAMAAMADGGVSHVKIGTKKLRRSLSLATSTQAPLAPATRHVAQLVAEITSKAFADLAARRELTDMVA